MDLKVLEEALQCTSVPSLNRVAGTSYQSKDYFIEGAKKELVKEACKNHDVELCSDEEDEVLTILEGFANYNSNQAKIRDLLYKYGYSVKPIKVSTIKEYEDINNESTPIIKESKPTKIILENAEESLDGPCPEYGSKDTHNKILTEAQPDDIEDILNKISMCPDYSSLYYMEEEFNKLGMTIAQANNKKVMLCSIGDDNKPKNTKIFEDYIFIGSVSNPDAELSNRFVECLTQFVKKAAKAPKFIENKEKYWLEGLAPYGEVLAIEQDHPTK